MDENNEQATQSRSWWLGILSFVPIIYVGWMLTYTFTRLLPEFIELAEQGDDFSPADMFHLFGPIIAWTVLAGLLHLFLLVWFIVHLMQDKTTTSNDRLVWLLLLIFLNPISFPFYWYFRMYRPVSMGS